MLGQQMQAAEKKKEPVQQVATWMKRLEPRLARLAKTWRLEAVLIAAWKAVVQNRRSVKSQHACDGDGDDAGGGDGEPRVPPWEEKWTLVLVPQNLQIHQQAQHASLSEKPASLASWSAFRFVPAAIALVGATLQHSVVVVAARLGAWRHEWHLIAGMQATMTTTRPELETVTVTVKLLLLHKRILAWAA